jgi:hypothetical protein
LALKLHILSILALKYIPKHRSKNISPNCTDDKQFSSVIYNQNKTKTKQYVEGVTRPIKTVKISPNFYYVYLSSLAGHSTHFQAGGDNPKVGKKILAFPTVQ